MLAVALAPSPTATDEMDSEGIFLSAVVHGLRSGARQTCRWLGQDGRHERARPRHAAGPTASCGCRPVTRSRQSPTLRFLEPGYPSLHWATVRTSWPRSKPVVVSRLFLNWAESCVAVALSDITTCARSACALFFLRSSGPCILLTIFFFFSLFFRLVPARFSIGPRLQRSSPHRFPFPRFVAPLSRLLR